MSNTFFTEPFVHLHDIVLDFLAVDPTIHAALPLLGVNRHWRSLTVQRLVREFQRTKLDKLEFDERTYLPKLTLSEGSYLKLHQSTLCPQEGAHKCDDPRYSLARGHPGSEMILLLSHFDPETLICTFTAPRADDEDEDDALLKLLGYGMPVNENGEEWADIAMTFSLVSSAWFRPTDVKDKEQAIYGLELAGRPDRFPLCGADGFYPEVVGPKDYRKKKVRVEVENKTLWNGWTASWHTIRMEEKPTRSMAHNGRVEVLLVVHDVKIPLIDLFCPRKTSAEKDYYEDTYGYGDDSSD